MTLSRRGLLGSSAALAALGTRRAQAADDILLGVSGPLTGPNAQYGAQWKDGFDLALADVGDTIGGRKLRYVFEDSQSDPRQAVGIAQKFVSNPAIVMELGDFSSPASMAASPIYQRAKLVQFGFTNSHPDFTKGGDYMWSSSLSQSDEQPKLAELAIKDLGFKRLAVLHLNTDWGRTSKEIFVKAAEALGGTVTAAEGFLPDEKDFRPTLVRIRDSNPDALVIISYYADCALIARQTRQQGLKQPMVASSSVYSPKLIELGGDAVEGIYLQSSYSPADPRPEVQNFIAKFRARYGRDPDAFNAYSYDAMVIAHTLIAQYGADRQAIHDGLPKVEVSTVLFGPAKFDPATRRISGPHYVRLQVKDGKFTVWGQGTKPA